MGFQENLIKSKFRIHKILVIISCLAIFFLLSLSRISAQTAPTSTSNPTQQSYDQACKNKLDPKNNTTYSKWYKDLYDAQNYDRNKPQPGNTSINNKADSDLLQAGCPPDISDISIIILRIVTVIITLFGLIIFSIIIRGAMRIIFSGANKDKVKKGYADFQMSIVSVVIVLISYLLIMFIAMRLGLSGNPDEFNVFDGTRLIFKFLFEY